MKIRTIVPFVSCLSAFTLPAFAQNAPAEKGDDLADEPAKTAEPPPASPSAAEPAPTPAATNDAQAAEVVEMGGTTAPKKRTSLGASPVTRGGNESEEASSEWKTDFHGYFRVPFRLGVGARPAPPRVNENPRTLSEADTSDLAPGQSKTTFHAPIIPDGQYLSWQSTSHNRSDWAELFFGIGNSWAKATVGIQGYNFTDASFNMPEAQYGIGQAFVTIAPDLGYENFRLSLKVGAYQDKYGAAGKYDAGEYDTYLFGRTHVMGETLRIEYDITDATGLWFEKGVGGKRPDPSSFNNSRFTMLAHAHAGLNLGSDLQFSTHILYSWAQEEDRPYNVSKPEASNYANSVVDHPDGNMWTAGIDARLDLGAFGYLYAGYAHLGAEHALVVGRALETIHVSGGGEYQLGVVDNYFGPGCTAGGDDPYMNLSAERTGALLGPGRVPFPAGCSGGTGTVDTLLAQYEFSLTNFLQMSEGGQKFWGEGSDLKVALYGMLNKVTSDFRPTDPTLWAPTDGNLKIKYGADLQYHATENITGAVRFDRLQPNSEVPEQSFSILSPRIVLHSNWVTREQITFQYSRYLYNQRECVNGVSPAEPLRLRQAGSALCVQPPPAATPPDGFGAHSEVQDADLRDAPTTRPDVNVFKIEATFWW